MKYFLDIAYKGTHYNGWQKQPNANTVQSEIENALKIVFKNELTTFGSGRTDTGVHAKQQYVMFETPQVIEKKKILNLNGVLPKDIVVKNIYKVADNASVRFDALSRSYEYFIHQEVNPFNRETSYYFPKKLDVRLMNEAAQLLLKYKDFECFSKVHTEVNTFLCTITVAKFEYKDEYLVFNITANRFLRGMVRAIVGTLLDVGTYRTSLTEFENIILSKDRKKAGRAAPPEGLFLSKVIFPENYLENI
ncbi:MAG: tRNA pseudouridine(38-40) synthase TruA [Cytophagales bacterium]